MTPGTNTPCQAPRSWRHESNAVQRRLAITDDNGAYRLDRLSEGEWQVTASKGGYISWQFGQRRSFSGAPDFTRAANDSPPISR